MDEKAKKVLEQYKKMLTSSLKASSDGQKSGAMVRPRLSGMPPGGKHLLGRLHLWSVFWSHLTHAGTECQFEATGVF